MIERSHDLPVTRQAAVLKLSRSSVYYRPKPVSSADLAVMRRIDELHLNYPFAGSRMLRDLLRGEGVVIGRELVATLMRRMGTEAIYCKPNTSKVALRHKLYLCLVTSSSTIQNVRIQVLTRGRRSVFTITICRRQRQHEFHHCCRTE